MLEYVNIWSYMAEGMQEREYSVHTVSKFKVIKKQYLKAMVPVYCLLPCRNALTVLLQSSPFPVWPDPH